MRHDRRGNRGSGEQATPQAGPSPEATAAEAAMAAGCRVIATFSGTIACAGPGSALPMESTTDF
jgi:hypothetical protein